jgi:hypothetical protein
MKTFIEIHLKNDADAKTDVFTAVLNVDELATVVRTGGLNAGNKALDSFVARLTGQLKERLGVYVNR